MRGRPSAQGAIPLNQRKLGAVEIWVLGAGATLDLAPEPPAESIVIGANAAACRFACDFIAAFDAIALELYAPLGAAWITAPQCRYLQRAAKAHTVALPPGIRRLRGSGDIALAGALQLVQQYPKLQSLIVYGLDFGGPYAEGLQPVLSEKALGRPVVPTRYHGQAENARKLFRQIAAAGCTVLNYSRS